MTRSSASLGRPELGPHRIGRREFLGRALGAALVPAGLACGQELVKAPADRPNVLFLMADQLRWDALGVNGGRIAPTPNLDRLAARSTNFTQAICPAPLCGPSRAGMLTGTLLGRHGCLSNERSDSVSGIREEVPTFDELLDAAGYRCEYHGKWHTGGNHRSCYAVGPGDFLMEYEREMRAKHRLSERADGAGLQRDFYTRLPYRPFSADGLMRAALAKDVFLAHRPEAGESPLPAEDSLTAWTAQRVIRFLRSRPAQPFCVTGSFLAPHAPLIAPAPYSTMFDPREMPLPPDLDDDWPLPPHVRAIPDALPRSAEGLGCFLALYFGLVAELDHWIGAVLRALEETGLAERTLVVFTSDHGEMLGSHRMVAKAVFFEEALRVPLFVRAPGQDGAQSAACVSARDLFATLLDFGGAALPAGPLASRSLRSLVGGAQESDFPFAVSELDGGGQRVRCLRTREWKLVTADERALLFDLAQDPGERRDLLAPGARSSEHLTLARVLRDDLHAFLADHGDREGAEALPRID